MGPALGPIFDVRGRQNGARNVLAARNTLKIEKTMATPILTLTEAAADRARMLMNQAGKPVAGIRVGVKTRGCSGYSYFVEYADEELPFEECVETDGVKVFIDPMATMFILGSEMDYKEDKLTSGFVFTNPNETGRCGCGESFSVDPEKA